MIISGPKLNLHKRFYPFVCLLLVATLLGACGSRAPQAEPASVKSTAYASPTPFVFRLDDSPATPTPSRTPARPTATPSITPNPGLPGVQLAEAGERIAPYNILRVGLLDVWGEGIPRWVGYSRNGQLIGIRTTYRKMAFVGTTYLPYEMRDEEWERAFPQAVLKIATLDEEEGQYAVQRYDTTVLVFQGYPYPQVISPDETMIAFPTDTRRMEIWRFADRRVFEINATTCHSSIGSAAFSPDNTLLAVGCAGPEETMVFSTIDGSTVQVIRVRGVTHAVGVALSPDNQRLAVMDIQGEVHLYNLARGGIEELVLSELSAPWPHGLLAFRPDGLGLLAANEKGMAVAWDFSRTDEEGVRYAELLGPAPDGQLAFAPDGSLLVAAAWNRLLLVNLLSGEMIPVPELSAPVMTAIPLVEGEKVEIKGGIAGQVEYLAYSTDGRYLAAQIPPWNVLLHSVPDYTPLRLLEISCCGVAFSPDGRRLAVGGESAVSLLGVPSWNSLDALDVSDQLVDLRYLPNGTALISSSAQALQIYSQVGQAQRSDLALGWTGRLALTNDGSLLAAETSQEVLLYRTSDWELIRSFPLFRRGLDALVFSPDGSLLVYSQQPGQIAIFDVASGARLGILQNPLVPLDQSDQAALSGQIAGLAFSPEGRLLVSSNTQGVLLVWGLK